MKKKILEMLLMAIIMLSVMMPSSLGYSDDLFEFDLPEGYANFSYQGMYAFSDSDEEDRGFIIYTRKNNEIKKSVWDVDDADLKDFIRKLSGSASMIRTEKRAKLGKEKAIKVILSEDDDYIELYILASNRYIYMVTFTGNSEADLENTDYAMIKKSFKLKDATTNFRLLYIIVAIIVIAIGAYIKYRKRSGYSNDKKSQSIDYKNLTEEDFKKM